MNLLLSQNKKIYKIGVILGDGGNVEILIKEYKFSVLSSGHLTYSMVAIVILPHIYTKGKKLVGLINLIVVISSQCIIKSSHHTHLKRMYIKPE